MKCIANLPRLYSAWQSKKHAQNAAASKKFGEYKITWCAIKNQLACHFSRACQGLPTPRLEDQMNEPDGQKCKETVCIHQGHKIPTSCRSFRGQ